MSENILSEDNEMPQKGREKESTGEVKDLEAGEVQKAGRGRPKSKPPSKLVSFHLPLNLIEAIEHESSDLTGGNKSLFIVKLVEGYFNSKI